MINLRIYNVTITKIRFVVLAATLLAIPAAILAGFAIAPRSIAKLAIVASAMFVVAWFYTRWRPRPKIARLVEGVALLLVFSASGAVLSYAGIAVGMPLQDSTFVALDEAIGFDWIAFLDFSSRAPLLSYLLIGAYHSSAFQIIAILVGLAFSGRLLALDQFLLAYMLSGLATVAVSTLVPAIGAYVYHAPDPAIMGMTAQAGVWHLQDFMALRDGVFRELNLVQVEGLISFPSFHTALAILTIWASWGWRWVRWPALVLNVLVIVSTLPEGGHYLVDLFAGGAIAVAAIMVASRVPAGRPIAIEPRGIPAVR